MQAFYRKGSGTSHRDRAPSGMRHPLRWRALPHLTGRDEILNGLFAAGRQAWPAVEISRATFGAHVLARLSEDADPAAALAGLHGPDLYLACACAEGDPRALEELERRLMPEVTQFLNRGDAFPGFADEVKQVLRERVLVGRP